MSSLIGKAIQADLERAAGNPDVRCEAGHPASLVWGTDIYPHRRDLGSKRFWRCSPCNAHVGVHRGTTQPLGKLADPTTRRARILAHIAFDPIWKTRLKARGYAYLWLSRQLGIPPGKQLHIGECDAATCHRIVEVSQKFLEKEGYKPPKLDAAAVEKLLEDLD